MTVQQLIDLLSNHPPEAKVDVKVIDYATPITLQREVAGVTVSGRRIVITTHED